MNSKNFIKNIAQLCRNAFLSSIFLMLSLTIAFALPGDLDLGFGTNGTVLTETEQQSSGKIVLVQPDGKILVGGTITYSGSPVNSDFVLVRYNVDGSLDSTFGNQGQTVTSILSRDTVEAGVLQPDGKIILAGEFNDKFILVRYNSDGSLDTSFGAGGKVTTFVVAVSVAQIQSILIQPDGKIVVVGDNTLDIYLLRYNADGTVDSSFGESGKVKTRFVNEGNAGSSVALQPDGKILVGGSVNSKVTARNSAIFRYNTNGTLDKSFDNDGVAIYPLSINHDSIQKILIRPDGKILSVGSSSNAEQNTSNYAIGVYDENGTPDSSFGTNGFSILPQIRVTRIEDALLQTDGKIVVGGIKSDLTGAVGWRFHIARFNSDGSFDFTFGNGGKVNLPVGNQSGGFSIAQQSDGKLLIAGFARPFGNTKNFFALNRLQGGAGQIPTSATIKGRVFDDFYKRGLSGVQVVLTSSSLSSPLKARTNPFGYYRFPNLPVNAEYNLTFETKKKASYQGSISNLILNGDEFADDLILRY